MKSIEFSCTNLFESFIYGKSFRLIKSSHLINYIDVHIRLIIRLKKGPFKSRDYIRDSLVNLKSRFFSPLFYVLYLIRKGKRGEEVT